MFIYTRNTSIPLSLAIASTCKRRKPSRRLCKYCRISGASCRVKIYAVNSPSPHGRVNDCSRTTITPKTYNQSKIFLIEFDR
jgi:hypothetical protein